MLIAEELLVLTFDEEGKKLKGIRLLDYGLAGAIIADLVLLNRLKFQGLKINVISNTSTDDELLDDILRLFFESGDQYKIQYFISRIRRNYRNLHSKLLMRLVNAGLFYETEEKRLGIIKRKKYSAKDTSIVMNLKNKIRELLLSNLEPDDRLRFLISLSRTCNIINYVLPDESDQMKIKNRIKAITKEEPISRSIRQLRDDAAAILAVAQMTTIYY